MTISFDLFDHETVSLDDIQALLKKKFSDLGHTLPDDENMAVINSSADWRDKQTAWKNVIRGLGYGKLDVSRDNMRGCYRYTLTPTPKP